jgi:hypothetical protein
MLPPERRKVLETLSADLELPSQAGLTQ